MTHKHIITGFSKLSRDAKIKLLLSEGIISKEMASELTTHLHKDKTLQAIYDEFSENTLSNFYIPFGLAPNFLINEKVYAIPFAIEESSVVAAAANAAKFWANHGGFHAKVLNNMKVGHVYFNWKGDKEAIVKLFQEKKEVLKRNLQKHSSGMEARGGGILSMQLIDKTEELTNYWQIKVEFRTADAMGANFINTILENLAKQWTELVSEELNSTDFEIIMAILSNYTPDSLVEVYVETQISKLEDISGISDGAEFARRFQRAVDIACVDPSRAVTHNKGILNGMDAVIIATGNDFRAVESCAHAFAASDGQYRSLSNVTIDKNNFRFSLQVPMSVGVVGGLTSIHPMAKVALEILNKPSAEELMMIIASVGLASNFSAVRSLVSDGIQKGHMKMHLGNILRQLNATEEEKGQANIYFKNREISHSLVKEFLQKI